jgi:diacylglycerol kinase (ATP)
MKNNDEGIARLISAFGYSLNGFKTAYRDEASFRQEVWLACVAIPLALFVDVTAYERAALIISILFILVVELLNTGTESLSDKVSTEYDLLIKKAKDVGSAAVTLALIIAAICWSAILL